MGKGSKKSKNLRSRTKQLAASPAAKFAGGIITGMAADFLEDVLENALKRLRQSRGRGRDSMRRPQTFPLASPPPGPDIHESPLLKGQQYRTSEEEQHPSRPPIDEGQEFGFWE